jgi:hypothetical protein
MTLRKGVESLGFPGFSAGFCGNEMAPVSHAVPQRRRDSRGKRAS